MALFLPAVKQYYYTTNNCITGFLILIVYFLVHMSVCHQMESTLVLTLQISEGTRFFLGPYFCKAFYGKVYLIRNS